MRGLKETIESLWLKEKPSFLYCMLLPFSWVFRVIVILRRYIYTMLLPRKRFSVPIVIVGNISVGGNGKTPCVIALANILKEKGYRVGIVSRGYGVRPIKAPLKVVPQSPYEKVGDEPVLIAKRTSCPVVICASRVHAVEYLLKNADCDVVLSDDGLQHYALSRDIEIVLIGGRKSLGNGQCLPAGPLREPFTRLKSVDFVMGDNNIAGVEYPIRTREMGFYKVGSDEPVSLSSLKSKSLYAYAGIAHPYRFFDALEKRGLKFKPCVFADHHSFSEADLMVHKDDIIVMTEKDAIRCQAFSLNNLYYMKIESEMDARFLNDFLEQLTKQKAA